MKNIKLLEEKISLRDEMLKFLLSVNQIEFDDALKLNNEISSYSNDIEKMQGYNYAKLQEYYFQPEIEIPSKLNSKT